MEKGQLSSQVEKLIQLAHAQLQQVDTYVQLLSILGSYALAYWLYCVTVKQRSAHFTEGKLSAHPMAVGLRKVISLSYPLIALLLLQLSSLIAAAINYPVWLINTAITVAVLIFFYSLIKEFVHNSVMSALFRFIGLPVLFLHLIDVLPFLISSLEAISVNLGNITISLYGLTRVLFFGAILFWLGRASSNIGKVIIRNQKTLDTSTQEVFTKLFEVGLFCVIFLLLLNIMGINLTALAVFGGALGVGLGLGLQSIASNFISGIIILLDKSLTIGDFVELDNGKSGFVREFKMRHAILETYDGKDILVPNETFISSMLINWTHKDPKQRYRVDFRVPFNTDIRAMVEVIKEAVATHPQVISGDDIPFEERPDCEIDSFGENGVNMFVEFWMQGIDDGKNRVGGDLLLIIHETLKEHGIAIPVPQREVTLADNKQLNK